MLGGGAANWSGTIDDAPTSIGKYEGAQAKYMIGLKSEPIQEDMDAATAAASSSSRATDPTFTVAAS